MMKVKTGEEICPFSLASGTPMECLGDRCRAHRNLYEENFGCDADGNNCTVTKIKGVCLLIPGDDAR